MQYRGNTADTVRNRECMKVGYQLKCIVMRMSVHDFHCKVCKGNGF